MIIIILQIPINTMVDDKQIYIHQIIITIPMDHQMEIFHIIHKMWVDNNNVIDDLLFLMHSSIPIKN